LSLSRVKEWYIVTFNSQNGNIKVHLNNGVKKVYTQSKSIVLLCSTGS